MGSRGCPLPPEGRGWGPAKSPYGGGSAGGPAVAWCSGSVVIVTGGTNTAASAAGGKRGGAEKVIAASGPTVEHVAGDRAYYRMSEDKIVLPEPGQFPTRNGYYQTALHECGHATGHPDRMNRDTLKEGLDKGFGSPEYAREELRAEISAMMTGERVGVGHDPQRGAAYVENWVKVLEKDPHEIHRAARDAQKMTDHLMNRAIDREVEKPSEEKTRAELTQEYSHARGPRISQTPKQSPEKQPTQAQQHDVGPSR